MKVSAGPVPENFYTTSENIVPGRASEHFIFYDPFYEELVARCKDQPVSSALNNLHGITETTAINSGKSPKRQLPDPDGEIPGLMESVCLSPVAQTRIIASLYADKDRLSAELERFRCIESDLRHQLSKQSDLEIKYLNALRLVDELNYQLNQPMS